MIAFQFQVNDEDHSIIVDQSFQIPDAVQEDSIHEESIGDVPEADSTVQYQVIEEGSSRGKRMLCDTDGFRYKVKVCNRFFFLW